MRKSVSKLIAFTMFGASICPMKDVATPILSASCSCVKPAFLRNFQDDIDIVFRKFFCHNIPLRLLFYILDWGCSIWYNYNICYSYSNFGYFADNLLSGNKGSARVRFQVDIRRTSGYLGWYFESPETVFHPKAPAFSLPDDGPNP